MAAGRRRGRSRLAAVRHDRGGQAAVELALALPVVVVFLLGVVQVALVARDQVAIELAAREAARAASVSADPTTAATMAAGRVVGLVPIDVAVHIDGVTVRVTVRYTDPTDVALIGAAPRSRHAAGDRGDGTGASRPLTRRCLRSGVVVLRFGWDQHHRAGRVVEDVLADRAEQQPTEAAPTA